MIFTLLSPKAFITWRWSGDKKNSEKRIGKLIFFFKRYFPLEITYEIFTVVVGQVKPLACQFLGFQANLKYRLLSFNSEKRTEKAFSKKRFFGLYRVINLDCEKVLSFYSQMLLLNDLELIFLCRTMFDVFSVKISLICVKYFLRNISLK